MGTPDDMMDIEGLLRAASCHVPGRPWHALRHTFARHFAMAGGNLLVLQKILGRGKFEMTQIYRHLAPDYMAGEIARLASAPSLSHTASCLWADSALAAGSLLILRSEVPIPSRTACV